MWRFEVFKFPVTVEWPFWLTMFFFGGGLNMQGGSNLNFTVLFMIAGFLSILVHELGHAFAGRKYGANPEIKLHAIGGVAILNGGYFNRQESIIVSAAGPAAGFALYLLSYLLLGFLGREGGSIVTTFLAILIYINLWWTILNLLPIQPLDGGQIFRDLMGPSQAETVRWVGVAVGTLVALYALDQGRVILCMMMALLAFQNYNQSPGDGGVSLR